MSRTLRIILTSALVRGIVGQVLGTALGYAFVAGDRKSVV